MAVTAPVCGASGMDGMTDRLVVSPEPAEYQLSRDGGATLAICYNWSCAKVAQMQFTAQEMAGVLAQMKACSGDGVYERLQRARIGVWGMEVLAQKYLPALANDLAVNDRDADAEGRTDCVDNATNTTTFLAILRDLGALEGWTLGAPRVRDRFTIDVHWTATLIDAQGGEEWAVDSWFRPHGHLPFVSPIAEWQAAHKPWLAPWDAYNPFPRSVLSLCKAGLRPVSGSQ